MKKILISACLLGHPVRYNGHCISFESPIVDQWEEAGRVISICPEIEAGMSIPRQPAEIIGGDGMDVIHGKARVLEKNGEDVSAIFQNGAARALKKCKENNVGIALLADSSPSCGSRTIHDGRFVGHKIVGAGVTTALLRQNGIQVFNQFEVFAASLALGTDV